MAVTEEAVRTLATVEVNDGCEVEVRQLRKRLAYSPDQAEQLAAELKTAALEARRYRRELIEEDARQRAARAGNEGGGIF